MVALCKNLSFVSYSFSFPFYFSFFSISTILLPLSCFQYRTIFTLRCSLQANKNTAAKRVLNCRKTQRILLKGQNASSFLRCQTSYFVTLWRHAEGIIRIRHWCIAIEDSVDKHYFLLRKERSVTEILPLSTDQFRKCNIRNN